MAEIVVCNSSPLIALSQLQQIDILFHLHGCIYVPPAVIRETARSLQYPSWVIESPLSKPIDARITARELGDGETETLALASELGATLTILDEKPARRLAQSLGLTVVGTVGLLISARRNGHIAVLRPLLDKLIQNRFFVSASLYEHALRLAGE